MERENTVEGKMVKKFMSRKIKSTKKREEIYANYYSPHRKNLCKLLIARIGKNK